MRGEPWLSEPFWMDTCGAEDCDEEVHANCLCEEHDDRDGREEAAWEFATGR